MLTAPCDVMGANSVIRNVPAGRPDRDSAFISFIDPHIKEAMLKGPGVSNPVDCSWNQVITLQNDLHAVLLKIG
jgi:hypothetical protein